MTLTQNCCAPGDKDAAYDRWWESVQPQLVNENAISPYENRFATISREQLGAFPGSGKK